MISRHFGRMDAAIDAQPIIAQLNQHPHLWGQQKARLRPGSPHSETQDIWLRFRDLDKYVQEHGADMSRFVDEHESVWLPPADLLTAAKAAAIHLAGDRLLGGVLLTRTPPGGRIAPHIDGGWHAAAHDKFYVALQVRSGARFCWEDSAINATDGEVYWFRNDVPHWVENDSDADRIGMIVCLRRER